MSNIASNTWNGLPHRWTRAELRQVCDSLIIDPEVRVELVDGTVYERHKQTPAHAYCLMVASSRLHDVLPPGWYVGPQHPVALSEYSETEPDVCLVRGVPADYLTGAPTGDNIGLLIEVADVSLSFDRGPKAAVYAGGGIADYWLVNLIDRYLEVRRRPVTVPDTPFGFAYSDVKAYPPGESVVLLNFSTLSIAVADLLPPAV